MCMISAADPTTSGAVKKPVASREVKIAAADPTTSGPVKKPVAGREVMFVFQTSTTTYSETGVSMLTRKKPTCYCH